MHLPFFTSDYLYYLSVMAARTLIILIFLVVMMRLLGKRQIGQMNVYDLVALMGIANAVQNAMTTGSGNLSVGLVAALVLLLSGRLISVLMVRAPRLEQHIIGAPTLLISDGEIVEEHMRREHVTEDELMAVLRSHGICDPSEATMAVLEVDGSISVVPRGEGGQRHRCADIPLT